MIIIGRSASESTLTEIAVINSSRSSNIYWAPTIYQTLWCIWEFIRTVMSGDAVCSLCKGKGGSEGAFSTPHIKALYKWVVKTAKMHVAQNLPSHSNLVQQTSNYTFYVKYNTLTVPRNTQEGQRRGI